jgi:hypothetical protein
MPCSAGETTCIAPNGKTTCCSNTRDRCDSTTGNCVPCPSAAPLVCGTTCINPQTDNANCGGCAATGQGVNCSAVGKVCCDGKCIDSNSTDPANCGGCTSQGLGKACLPGQSCCMDGSTLTCIEPLTNRDHCGPTGTCGRACADNQNCINGDCVDDQACDPPCNTAGGQICVDGDCQCPNGKGPCPDDTCVDLGTDANCGACQDTCTGNQKCCNNRCTPLGTNQNCSGCNDICQGGSTCTSGLCLCPNGLPPVSGSCDQCAEGLTYCTSASFPTLNRCTSMQFDQAHCGACRHYCVGLHPDGPQCFNGQCYPSSADCSSGTCVCPPDRPDLCDYGTSNCGGDITCQTVGCVNLQKDPGNCGTCGNNCGNVTNGQLFICCNGACCPVTAPYCTAGGCSATPP